MNNGRWISFKTAWPEDGKTFWFCGGKDYKDARLKNNQKPPVGKTSYLSTHGWEDLFWQYADFEGPPSPLEEKKDACIGKRYNVFSDGHCEEDPDGTHMLVSIVEEGEKAEWVLKETSKQLHICMGPTNYGHYECQEQLDGSFLASVYDGMDRARFSMRVCSFCGYRTGEK